MIKVKDLYLCQNIDDLERRTQIPDVRQSEMQRLLQSARKVYQEAEMKYREGDEEKAYIFYTKYFNLLNNIHKRPEYPRSKPQIREMLGDNRSNKMIMGRLETLTKSLTERYKQQQQQQQQQHETIKSPASSSTSTSAVENHRSRSVSPQPKPQLNILRLITCQQLFDCMQACNVLIMDCRLMEDYNRSHLDYPFCFNVPQEYIQAGMSAGRIQEKLDMESKKLWSARAVKKHIVLMDWNCNVAEPDEGTPIAILLDILQNWDPDVVYHSMIKILEGGYEYFIMMYPAYCTDPTVKAPELDSTTTQLGLIEYIEYPTVNDIQLKDDIIAMNGVGGGLGGGAGVGGTVKNVNNSRVSLQERESRPVIDRLSKQAAIKVYEAKQKAIDDIAKEQEVLLEKAKENDEQLQQVAKHWNNIYNKPQLTASEQELLYNMMQLESAAEDYKNENIRLKEELENYKSRERQNASMQYMMADEEEEVTKKIEAKIQERQRIDEQFERERQQRAKQVALVKENRTTATTLLLNNERREKDALEGDKENISVAQTLLPAPPAPVFAPKFDRSTKPAQFATSAAVVTSPSIGNYRDYDRQRDFSPTPDCAGRGLTGLKNLGNTCYMNSIIQCLSNTRQLAEYCVSDRYRTSINRNNKTKGEIIEELAALIKILWSGSNKSVAGKDLRIVIGQYQKMFRGIEQQDSHEFLTILIDWLHSDLQTQCAPETLKEPVTAYDKAWQDFTKLKESFILNLFYGQIKSIVKCATCATESATYDCFSNLSLELPDNNNACYLSQCLDMYFSGERIHGWNCPDCKQKRDAIKKLNISKLPTILIIHLKRFHANVGSLSPSYKKKQNYVRFPVENLDMTNYLTVSETKHKTSKFYNLYAVSNHYGSMERGHYTAFCKVHNYNRWFKFDDQFVTCLDSTSVVSSAAYILFYTRLPYMQHLPEEFNV